MKKWQKRALIAVVVIAVFLLLCWAMLLLPDRKADEKPVIYLYPESETEVSVTLELDGKLTTTYPLGERSDREVGSPALPKESTHMGSPTGSIPSASGTSSVSWQVTAQPDGTLTDTSGNTYSYLYCEGETDTQYDLSKGFVVKGEDSADFLREKLSYMGLTPREYNEFIVYWLPRLEANEYNLITFQGGAYTDSARLQITPEPDSLLRVFMAFKPLARPIDIPEQELTPFTRTGFTVVEWGGCEVK